MRRFVLTGVMIWTFGLLLCGIATPALAASSLGNAPASIASITTSPSDILPTDGTLQGDLTQNNGQTDTPSQTSGLPSVTSLASTLTEDQLKMTDTSSLDKFWNHVQSEYGQYIPNTGPSLAQALLPGAKHLSVTEMLRGLLKFFFQELWQNSRLMGTIILLSVFAAVLEAMQSAFEKSTVSKVSFAVVYLVLIVIAIGSFKGAMGYAKGAISDMTDFMTAMVPLVLSLLAATGNVTSVAMIHPIVVAVVNIVGTLIYDVVFPLIFFSAILHIVSTISDRYQLTQLGNLLRTASILCLGTFLSVFLGVISVQSVAGAVVDGVTLRAAKFVSSNFVPVVGKMFSDAADTVIGASLLVKNSIGLAGVIILLIICAFPALKIVSLAVIYNATAALMQPLGDSPIIGCLNTIAKSLVLVFAAMATVGMMFFLAVTIMIAAGNITAMVR